MLDSKRPYPQYEHRRTGFAERLPFAGRMVVLLALRGPVAVAIAYIVWICERLPPGRYPGWLFYIPAVVAVELFCAGLMVILPALGVDLMRDASPADEEPDDDGARRSVDSGKRFE